MLSPKVTDNDAWALLSLRSAPSSPRRMSAPGGRWSPEGGPKGAAVARLDGRDFEYTLRLPQRRVTVGRSSSKGEVDINMEHSSFVSRNHLQISYTADDNGRGRFFLTCSGKNGIFVDGIFQRKGADPMELPRSCTLRFPSTTLKISFQSLVESDGPPPPPPSMVLPPKYAKPVQPLMISVPPPPRADVPNLISPCPSPTGTISAANSCPTSPRSSGSSVRSMLALDLPSAAAAAAFARNHSSCDDMKEPLPYGTISTEEEVPGGGGGSEKSKPPYSYAQLIVQAITSHPDHQLTLSGIYGYISKHYPYYKATDKGWQNSIRHNLSLNRFFVKVPRSQEEPGKGSFWRIDSSSEGKLMEQAFRRRRQRVSCFRSPVGGDLSSRSAPVSPSHYDGSFTPEGTPHSAGLMPDASGAGDADAEVRQQDSKSLESQPVTLVPPASSRLLQLTNDLRFIQSAPVSPQGGPVQLMTLPNSVVAPSSVALSRTAAGVAFHPLSTLAGKQGVYLLQQTAPGGATLPTTVSLATGVGGVSNAINKETDKSLMLKSIGNGSMLQSDAAIAQPQLHPPQRLCTTSASALSSASVSSSTASNSSLSPSSASVFSQLPITFIQPGSGVQSNDLIQKLLRQGAMVVGRMPEEGQSPAVYSLPQSVMQPGFQPFHVVLGTQLVKPGDAMGNVEQGKGVVQPQIVMLPGTQGFKIEKLSPPVKLSNSTSPIATQASSMPEKSDVRADDSLSKGIVTTNAAAKDGVSASSEAEMNSEKKDDAVGSIVSSLSSEVGGSVDQIRFVGLSSTSATSSYSAKDSTSGMYADLAKADKRPASVDEASLVQSMADKRLRLDGDQ